MSEAEPAIARGRSLLRELLGMAQTRLEMLAIELEQEKLWVMRVLRAALVTVICAWLAGFTLILWVALALAPGVRFIVLAALFVAFLLGAVVGWIVLMRSMRRHAPLARLISQLRLDRASLGPEP
ncbi:MAG: phage holin family protein [Steroidobacteraceae bacterium]